MSGSLPKPVKFIYKKNKLLYPLLIVVTVIWGLIVYRVIDFFTAGEDEEIIADDNKLPLVIDKPENDYRDSLVFVQLERDPFIFPKEEKKVEYKPTVNKEIIAETKPEFRYAVNGVIINNDQKVVIIEDLTTNETLFLREGDSYKTIKIQTIESNLLSLLEDGKLRRFKVQE